MAVPQQQRDDNQSIPYFIIKCTTGFFYYRWLHATNLTSPKVRWLTFQIISPIIKLYHLNHHTNNSATTTTRRRRHSLYSPSFMTSLHQVYTTLSSFILKVSGIHLVLYHLYSHQWRYLNIFLGVRCYS